MLLSKVPQSVQVAIAQHVQLHDERADVSQVEPAHPRLSALREGGRKPVDGRFELQQGEFHVRIRPIGDTHPTCVGQGVRLHLEHPGKPPNRFFCGADKLSFDLLRRGTRKGERDEDFGEDHLGKQLHRQLEPGDDAQQRRGGEKDAGSNGTPYREI